MAMSKVHTKQKEYKKAASSPQEHEGGSLFFKEVIDKILNYYRDLEKARDFDKVDEPKERILRKEIKKLVGEVVSNHTTERAIEDDCPFTDISFKNDKLATVGFDLRISPTSKIMIFLVTKDKIKKIQTIQKKKLIILSLELEEDGKILYTGGFKSGVGIWRFDMGMQQYVFVRDIGFEKYQIRNIFWNEQQQILVVKRRFEDRSYDELFGYFKKKGDNDYEKVVFNEAYKGIETMIDNDCFNANGEYFVLSLPDPGNSKFPPRAFFSMKRPRRREKKVAIAKYDHKKDKLTPIIGLVSLCGKVAFVEGNSHIVYLKETGCLKIFKLQDENTRSGESQMELDDSSSSNFEEISMVDESTTFSFKGVLQTEIDSFDINDSNELLALTQKNKMYVYEIEENWNCSMVMEYEDEVVMDPPILSIRFSTDSNFILSMGHRKIVIVDIYRKERMAQLSTVKGIEKIEVDIVSAIKNKVILRKNIKPKGSNNSSSERLFKKKSLTDMEKDEKSKQEKKEDTSLKSIKARPSMFNVRQLKTLKNDFGFDGLGLQGRKFKADYPKFYFSGDEECIMVIDESLHKNKNQNKSLNICRWTNINTTGNNQTLVKSKIYSNNLPENIFARVVDVSRDNEGIILSVLRYEDIQRKVTVTEILVFILDEKKREFVQVDLDQKGDNIDSRRKYFRAQFLNNSLNVLTLDSEFNPKIWEFDPVALKYSPHMILDDQKLNYSRSVLSLDNRFLITEDKNKISLWTLDDKKSDQKSKKAKYNFKLDQKIMLKESAGDVKEILITKDKSKIILHTKPAELDKMIHSSRQGTEALLRVYLKDESGVFCLIQTEKISEKFQLKQDLDSSYLLLKFEEQTEIWKINPRDICYEGALPSLEYDQISPSFSRTLEMIRSQSEFIYFKLRDLRRGFLQIEKNLKNLYMLKELFNTNTHLINNEAISKFLDVSNEFGNDKADQMQQLHSKFSLLLLTTLTRNPELLRAVLNEVEYIPFFYKEGYDPIDFSITMGHLDSLDEITNYFKISSSSRMNPLISYLDIERLSKSMRTYSHNFRDFVIDCFLGNTPISNDDIEIVDSFPLDDSGCEIIECWTRFLDEKLFKTIMKKSEENFFNKKDPVKVKLLTTSFPINPNIIFNSNTLILESIENLPNELLVGNIKYILRYLWKKNWFTIAIFSFINWLNFFLFILYVIFFNSTQIFGILNIIFSSIFLVFELMMAIKSWARWARDTENYIDLFQFSAMPTLCILNLINMADPGNIAFNFAVNFTILVAGFQCLLKVKIFKPVRYMIDMLMQVFADMVGFSVIFGFAILYFSFIGIYSSRASSADPFEIDTISDFLVLLDAYYNVSFGDFSIIRKENWSHVAYYMATTVVLALVFFNLMAATIWETFGNFQQKKELVDLKSMSSILVDYTHLFSYIGSFGFLKRLDEKGLVYLCMIVPSDLNASIHQDIKEVKRKIEENTEELEAVSTRMSQDIMEVENTLDDVKEETGRIEKIEERLNQVVEMLIEIRNSGNTL